MIKSMTGFGRCEMAENDRKFTVEIKSVNHRYLDVSIKLPKALNFFESSIRSELKSYISRGKVDVYVSYEDFSEKTSVVCYHRELAEEYLRYLRRMGEEFGLENDVRVSTLSRFPEIFTMEEAGVDQEELWKELLGALTGAARMFVDTRVAEGEHLKCDLIEKLDGMRQRVDEEIVRLYSHIETTRNTLLEGGAIGRKLDFIAQEMNREANTILSKSTDLEISNCAIELKTEIEKVREQIQNIE